MLKRIILSVILMLGGLTLSFAPVYAAPQSSLEAVCEGVGSVDGSGKCDTGGSDKKVKDVINLAIRILQMVVGIISVFVLIIAGLGYITSGGDASKTKTAKDRIIYAAIGIVVVVLAEVIVQFVLNRVATVAK